MPLAKETRLRGHLGRGALLAIWLHAQIFVPLLVLISVYAAREEAQRAEEVDVAFRDASNEELPADLPSLDEPPPTPEASPTTPDEAEKHADKQKKKKPKDKVPPPKLAAKQPEPPKAKPEPEVPIPPMPPMPKPEAPPIPKPQDQSHQKMVDLDNDKEVEPPPDAKFLAQKNNRAAVETRATDTNLEKMQKGSEGSSSPSDRQDQEIGDDKAKIAELEDMKSQLGRKAPAVTPHTNPELSERETPQAPKSLLALRDAPRREHELTPETVDPSLPRTADGTMSTPSDRGARGPRSDPAHLDKGARMKLALSAKDYEYLFGADAEAERRLAQKERSKKPGRFQQRLGRVQSALENFIPEVKPGNQTALNTRAAPFAAFVARMHRSIHKLWGFGMLEDWDEKSGSNPFNNPNLLTTLELVLNGDGMIDKVTIVKTSGYMPYDAAAIDVAYSAGPYPDPPREIRSKNGKIYIHWRFYRDARQCATSGVDYFILDNPPPDGDTTGATVPERAAPAGARGATGGGSESPSLADGPRRLERNPSGAGSGGGARMHAVSEEVLPAAESESAATPAPAAAPAPNSASSRGDNPAARLLAQSWFAAFARGDVQAMLSQAVYPFRSSNGNAASKRSELEKMLRGLVDESATPNRTVTSVQLLTAAGLRGAIGRLPPGLDDGSGALFAVARTAGNDALILVVARRGDSWKIAGLARR